MSAGRRRAREDALKILYQLAVNDSLNVEGALKQFEEHFRRENKPANDFTQKLVEGVSDHIDEIDKQLAQLSKKWKLERMPIVDRNILRIGAYEILHCEDIPKEVSIDEMVELAKEFGDEGTASFVNGVLDKLG